MVVTRDIDMNPEPTVTAAVNLDQAEPMELPDEEAQLVVPAPAQEVKSSPRKTQIRALFAKNIIN
jgi:hypothetical protein